MTQAQQHKKELQEKLRTLNEINRKLIVCKTLEEVTTEALKQVRHHLNVQVASMFLFSKDGYIQRVGIDGVDKDNNSIDGKQWLPNEKYLPGESFSGKPVPPSDAELTYGEPHYSNELMEEYKYMINGQRYRDKLGQVKSGISVPLNGLNRTFGTLEVLNKQKDNKLIDFDNDDIYILMLVGTVLSSIVADFRRKEKLHIYHEMTQMLIKLESEKNNFVLQDVYRFVVNKLVASKTEYKVAIIRIFNKNKEFEIAEQAKTEDILWRYRKKDPVERENNIVAEVFNKNKPLKIENIEKEIDRFFNQEWIRESKLKSFICLPLSLGEKPVGTLSIYVGYKHKFSKSGIYFLENIAFLTAGIIAIDSYKNQLKQTQLELEHERLELEHERRKFTSISRSLSYNSVMKNFLHKYKNELIEFCEDLHQLSDESQNSNQQKRKIIQNRVNWIKNRVQEMKDAFQATNHNLDIVDINEISREVVRLFSSIKNRIEIEEDYDPTIPLIEIDGNRIKDVIYNLIDNAVEAINEKNKKDKYIKITTNIVMIDDIQYIQVIIEDSGTGIRNELKEKIFEQGYTSHPESGGTGIGLFVSREIISDYGGKLGFTSQFGKGTTFSMCLPLKRYQL